MTETTITYSQQLTVVHCCDCGMAFAMPADYDRRRRNDHKWFWCPAGHEQHFIGETEAEILRRQLEQANRRAMRLSATADQAAARADHEAARARGYKGQLTKTKKRVGNGVCPCCNRSFGDLAKHMASKHPDFGGAA